MSITNSFKEAVSNNNIIGIRIMMKDSLLLDYSFSDFNEMSRLASGVNGLYDTHDGYEFQMERSNWNIAYMNKLMAQVIENFSNERLQHLKEVVRYLNPINQESQGITNEQSPSVTHNKSSYHEQKNHEKETDNCRVAKIAGGAVVGAIAGAIIATIASATLVDCVVMGTLVGGATVTVITKGA